MQGAARKTSYASPEYYSLVDRQSLAGYEDYSKEQHYRETKGSRLLDWIESVTGARKRLLLEVGCGFGYTRRAAETRGLRTTGVDVNPYAAEQARDLYGMDTFVGSLSAALLSGVVPAAGHDLVLYQFVLEHLSDPCAELCLATRALAPGGALVLVVPSADAAEIDVFGAAYRSVRGDHLHLFSRRSIEAALARVGLAICGLKTECSIHLLRGFLSIEELERDVYAAGRGPDMLVVAQRTT